MRVLVLVDCTGTVLRVFNSGETVFSIIYYIVYLVASIGRLEGFGRGACRGFALLREPRNQWSWH
jgi:hypothetical protein